VPELSFPERLAQLVDGDLKAAHLFQSSLPLEIEPLARSAECVELLGRTD